MPFNLNSSVTTPPIDYAVLENKFAELIRLQDLDAKIDDNPAWKESFEDILEAAFVEAFDSEEGEPESMLFLQRTLYRINRMKFFWYDDLDNYNNENSRFLFEVQSRIESAWQEWEADHVYTGPVSAQEVTARLQEKVAEDLDPDPSERDLYFRNETSKTGYRHLLAIASIDGLVEASQMSRVLGGVSNEIHARLTKIFLEEYGNGNLSRKHSSFFKSMLEELDMKTRPEAYFELAPWQVLANINHSFFLCEQKRNFLQYIGALLFFEVSVPASFKNYQLAGERLGLSPEAVDYWRLHIKEDERHGRWMLDDVALPLVDFYPSAAWEIVRGYDQQRFISARAGQAVFESVRQAERG